jgi:hypothetical protein
VVTAHALERIAERAPGADPRIILARLQRHLAGEPQPFAVTVTGDEIHRVPDVLPALYAVVAADGAVVTVLTAGMRVTTPAGERLLPGEPPLDAGLHRLPPTRYHADPAPAPSLSSTLARIVLNQSPLHAWTASPRLNPAWEPTEKKVFDLGRAIHRATLGHGGDYIAYPPDLLATNGAASTKAAKAWEAERRAEGLTPLKADEVEQIETVGAAVAARLLDMGIRIDPDDTEVAALAEIDGTWCRLMADFAPRRRDFILDLKSTTDASPEACVRAVVTYGLDVQAAHYQAVWEAATGERRRFLFAFVEKEPPHEVGVVELHDAPGDEADWMEDARAKVAHARTVWRDCLEAGSWPGYPARIGVIGAPGYHRQKWEQKGANVWEPPPRPSAAALATAHRMQAPQGGTP